MLVYFLHLLRSLGLQAPGDSALAFWVAKYDWIQPENGRRTILMLGKTFAGNMNFLETIGLEKLLRIY